MPGLSHESGLSNADTTFTLSIHILMVVDIDNDECLILYAPLDYTYTGDCAHIALRSSCRERSKNALNKLHMYNG